MYDASLRAIGDTSGGGGSIGQSGSSSATGGSNSGMGDGDLAGEPAVTGGAVGFGGAFAEAGAPDTGGMAEGGMAPGNEAGHAGIGGGGTSGTGAGGAVAGSGGANPSATGCAKLSIPLDDAADKAHLVITLTSPADLSSATISMRVYVQAGVGGTLFNYVQDSGTYHFLGVPLAQRQNLSSLSGWSTLTWNVGAEPEAGSGIVKASIKNIGIEVNALPSSSWSNPTLIYLDSLTVMSPTVTSTFTFDATSSVYPTPTTANVSGQALWINAGATDTTASGSTLSWQATCP